jgi:hypothetical protein
MLGSKSSEKSARFDTFTCLRCDAVMTVGPSENSGKHRNGGAGR